MLFTLPTATQAGNAYLPQPSASPPQPPHHPAPAGPRLDILPGDTTHDELLTRAIEAVSASSR